jgi:hypothetical protein
MKVNDVFAYFIIGAGRVSDAFKVYVPCEKLIGVV